jgi:hypothetical protein
LNVYGPGRLRSGVELAIRPAATSIFLVTAATVSGSSAGASLELPLSSPHPDAASARASAAQANVDRFRKRTQDNRGHSTARNPIEPDSNRRHVKFRLIASSLPAAEV